MGAKTKKDFLSEAFLLAALSAALFASAYHYEKGFLEYFGILPDIITVTPERFFAPANVLLIYLWLVLFFMGGVRAILPNKIKNNYNAYIFIAALFWLGYKFFLLGENFFSWINLLNAILFVIMVFLSLAFSYTYGDEEATKIEIEASQKNPLNYFFDTKFGKCIIVCLLLSLVFFRVPEYFGKSAASSINSYLTFTDGLSKYALIRTYGNLFVFVEIHSEWVSLYDKKSFLGEKVLFLHMPLEDKGMIAENMAISKSED